MPLLRRLRPAALLLTLLAAAPPRPAAAQSLPEDSSCVPRGKAPSSYLWSRLHVVQRGDGTEAPTPESLEYLNKNQSEQVVLDPVRNVRVAFINGLTLEAPAGSDRWTVVETASCAPARWAAAMAYDPVNDEIVLWGGTMSVEGPTHDTWIYTPSSREWRKLEIGSPEMRDLRAGTEALQQDLEFLRWQLWKTLEWTVTGKDGALAPTALAERLAALRADLESLEGAAGAVAGRLDGYEASQVAGARPWLAAMGDKLAAIGGGLEAGTAEAMEGDYRALAGVLPDMLSAADALRYAPPPRYFVSLTYDAAREALVLGSTVEADHGDEWIYRLRERRWERTRPAPGAPVTVTAPEGEFVLRDAVGVAQLRDWQAKTKAWAESLPPNTWVKAPANGTGRPNWGRSWSSIVYDPDREQLYYRDGGHGMYHGSVTDHYDIRTGRWFRSDVAQVPSGRIMGTYFGWGRGYDYAPWAIHTYKWSLFYNPLTKHLQRTVLHTPDRWKGGNLNDYDPDLGQWSAELARVKLVGPVVPGVTDGLLSVRAWQRYGPLPSATVGYQTADGYKEWTSTGPLPFHGAHYDDDYGFFFDPARGRAMYYGGEGEETGIYALDLGSARPKWERLPAKVADGGELPRPYREWIYIPRHDVFLTMAWQHYEDTSAPQVWSFDPKTNLFRRVELALGPDVAVGKGASQLRPAAVSSGLAYDPVSDVAFHIHAHLKSPTMFAFRFVPEGP